MSFVLRMIAAAAMSVAAWAESADYRLGAGDTVTVQAREVEELVEKKYQIDAQGNLNLPVAGGLKVAGLTTQELEREVERRLREFYHRPAVTVVLTETQNRPVSVLGWVNHPGVYQLTGPRTLVEILSAAGGVRVDAGSAVHITRRVDQGELPLPGATKDAGEKFHTGAVGLRDILEGRNAVSSFQVKPHDVITVPKGEMVYVMGDVNKPGGFVLDYHEKITVLRALALSAGMQRTAAPKNARILRRPANGGEKKEIVFDLRKVLDGKQPDVDLMTDDILFVPSSLAKRATLRTIESVVQAGTGVAVWRGSR